MKPKITTLLLSIVLLATTTFASPGKGSINREISSSFNQKFADAKEVTWQTTDKYVKATFKLNDQVMFAYFTTTGELVGVSRNILSSQLPMNLQNELKKELTEGWVTELFEFATEEGTMYYATIENGENKTMLKSVASVSWELAKKVKKISL